VTVIESANFADAETTGVNRRTGTGWKACKGPVSAM
jgi:hypothetical protein